MANLTLDEYTAAQRKIHDAYAADEIKKKQAAVDTSVAAVKAQGEKDIESTNASYEDVFRKNNLNQIINEEQTKERMANLGLTDSGLNRSQQTAIQLQRSNADAATIRNRQAAVDEIRKGIANYVTAAEAQKAEIDSTVRSNWMQKADANAVALYNQQEANNAAIRAAEIEAENKKVEAQATAYKELMDAINNDSYSFNYKSNLVSNYVDKYGISKDSQIYMQLIKSIGGKVNEDKTITESGRAEKTVGVLQNNFRTVTGDNFDVKIGDTKYRLENEGKVSDSNIIQELNKHNPADESVLMLDGNIYVKYAGAYYKAGSTDGLFNWWSKHTDDKFIRALQEDKKQRENEL